MTKPVAGYRTQRDAIETMYQRGRHAQHIADATGVPRASVDATISRYRKRAGISVPKETRGVVGGIWEQSPAVLRQHIALRASRGARKALEAAGL